MGVSGLLRGCWMRRMGGDCSLDARSGNARFMPGARRQFRCRGPADALHKKAAKEGAQALATMSPEQRAIVCACGSRGC